MKTNYVKNVPVTDTALEPGTVLKSMYVTNITSTNKTFSIKLEDAYIIKDLSLEPNVTVHFFEDMPIHYKTDRITISSEQNASVDVVYTIE